MTVALSWSSGKDAAWALHLLRQQGENVVALVTTFIQGEDRSVMHRTRRSVVRRQAALVDLPLVEIELPWPCTDAMYEFALSAAIEDLKYREGVTEVAYGDLFLPDVRKFREDLLGRIGITPSFPLWGMRSDLLAQRMLRGGVEARITCVDPKRMDPESAGAAWDAHLVRHLPPEIDPCGENGEFHTVITNGPMFASPLSLHVAGIFEMDGFVHADLSDQRPVDG